MEITVILTALARIRLKKADMFGVNADSGAPYGGVDRSSTAGC